LLATAEQAGQSQQTEPFWQSHNSGGVRRSDFPFCSHWSIHGRDFHYRFSNIVWLRTLRAAAKSATALAVSDLACTVARRMSLSVRSASSKSTKEAPPFS